jgi:hypothetical protein
MMFGYLTLFTALIISLSAAVYSILGLTAIFAAAFWPIVVLGGSLEFGKIVTTLWLHKYWDRAEIQYKVYLCSAVAILMLLTSMGVFGFLSKAHLDQAVPSGDVAAKVQIFDDKIKTQRDNIDAARKALAQMDSAVDQTMSRSTTEQGADKAAGLRRSQARERTALQNDISKAQKEITVLQEQRAPVASEMRKVEAEVGPIKYIAALVYGDNPEANTLEKAVRWVIILIVIVFDPLALTLLLAATKTFEWERSIDIFAPKKRDEDEPDNGALTDAQLDQLNKTLQDQALADKLLKEGVIGVAPEASVPVNKKEQILTGLNDLWKTTKSRFVKDSEAEQASLETPAEESAEEDPHKEAKRAWKLVNPGDTLKKYEKLYADGHITELPWTTKEFKAHQALNAFKGFGNNFPESANKGDTFIKTDRVPSLLFKYNGTQWIPVDKENTDTYAYDEAYIDFLIAKLETGEYDAELLTDAERDSIEHRLNNKG